MFVLYPEVVDTVIGHLEGGRRVWINGPESCGKTELVRYIVDKMCHDIVVVDLDGAKYDVILECVRTNNIFSPRPIVYVFRHYVDSFVREDLVRVFRAMRGIRLNKMIFISEKQLFFGDQVTRWELNPVILNMPNAATMIKFLDNCLTRHECTMTNMGKTDFLNDYDTPRLVSLHVNEICRIYGKGGLASRASRLNAKHVKKYCYSNSLDKVMGIQEQISYLIDGKRDYNKCCLQIPSWIFYNLRTGSVDRHFEVIDKISESDIFYDRVINYFEYDMYELASIVCSYGLGLKSGDLLEGVKYPRNLHTTHTFHTKNTGKVR